MTTERNDMPPPQPKPDGGPAFPGQPRGSDNMPVDEYAYGLTLRDYFAGKALDECIRVAADQTPGDAPLLSDLFAKAAAYAYFAADAMLQEREKP